MITDVGPDRMPELMEVQVACIHSLGGWYPQENREAWIEFLEKGETEERYATFRNSVWTGNSGVIEGFVSWSFGDGWLQGSVERLYVSSSARGRGIGRQLLLHAEGQMVGAVWADVRSTLNARMFYEKNGYLPQGETLSRARFVAVEMRKVFGLQQETGVRGFSDGVR